jgi:hypothetical protein
MEPLPPPPGWHRIGWNFGSIVFAVLIGVMVGATVDLIAGSIGGLETDNHAIDVACAWLGLAVFLAVATIMIAIEGIRDAVIPRPRNRRRPPKVMT